jgi:hypothetical protein
VEDLAGGGRGPRGLGADGSAPLPDDAALAAAADEIVGREDRRYGGFGTAPKFPVATTLRFLQAEGRTDVVARALDAMAASELCDEDGGFFRYATQQDWSVPHYERMLIDNAQLLDVAVDAGGRGRRAGIAHFLLAVLQRPGGGFGARRTPSRGSTGSAARRLLPPPAPRASGGSPAVDGKIIAGWNGLAIGALAGPEPPRRAVLDRRRRPRGGDRAGGEPRRGRAARAHLARRRSLGGRRHRCRPRAARGRPAGSRWPRARRGGRRGGWRCSAPTRSPTRCSPRRRSPGPRTAETAICPPARPPARPHLTAWRLGARAAPTARRPRPASARGAALRHPFGSGALRAAAGLARPPRIVAVTSGSARTARGGGAPADVDLAAVLSPQQARAFAEAGFTLFEGRDGVDGVVYDCRGFVCRLPVSDPALVPAAR